MLRDNGLLPVVFASALLPFRGNGLLPDILKVSPPGVFSGTSPGRAMPRSTVLLPGVFVVRKTIP